MYLSLSEMCICHSGTYVKLSETCICQTVRYVFVTQGMCICHSGNVYLSLRELWNNLVILLSLILCVLMLVAWDAKASMADLPSVGEVLLTANSSLYE